MRNCLVGTHHDKIWKTQRSTDNPCTIFNDLIGLIQIFVHINADISLPSNHDNYILLQQSALRQNNRGHYGYDSLASNGLAVGVQNVEPLQLSAEDNVAQVSVLVGTEQRHCWDGVFLVYALVENFLDQLSRLRNTSLFL